MKKLISALLLSLALNSIALAATGNIGLNINGKTVAAQPFVREGVTMVPLRVIANNLGAAISYESLGRNLLITKGKKEIYMTVGSNVATYNNSTVIIDAEPEIKNGSVYVPLRVISEALGVNVQFKSGTVYLTDKAKNTGVLVKQYTDFASHKEAIQYVADTLGWDYSYCVTGEVNLIAPGNGLWDKTDVEYSDMIRSYMDLGAQPNLSYVEPLIKFYLGDEEGSQAFQVIKKCVETAGESGHAGAQYLTPDGKITVSIVRPSSLWYIQTYVE